MLHKKHWLVTTDMIITSVTTLIMNVHLSSVESSLYPLPLWLAHIYFSSADVYSAVVHIHSVHRAQYILFKAGPACFLPLRCCTLLQVSETHHLICCITWGRIVLFSCTFRFCALILWFVYLSFAKLLLKLLLLVSIPQLFIFSKIFICGCKIIKCLFS